MAVVKRHKPQINNKQALQRGFTLIELIAVIVILAIVSVGVTNFITSSTAIYVNTAERDELLAKSRYTIERLNREIRYALPNSVRVGAYIFDDRVVSHCLEFTPIEWSTFYLDISTGAEVASNTIEGPEMVSALTEAGNYDKSEASNHYVVIYPTQVEQVYEPMSYGGTGRRVGLQSVGDSGVGTDPGLVVATLDNAMVFEEESTISRFYIVNQPISYCLRAATGEITRHTNYGFLPTQVANPDGPINPAVNPSAEMVLMAEDVVNNLSTDPTDPDINNGDPFRVSEASLARNAIVHVMLQFERNDERVVFNNEVHLQNVP